MASASAGAVLRDARQRRGLSQREVARRAGTSSATVSLYESGVKEPRLSTLARLLEATGHRLEVEAIPFAGRDRTQARSQALHLAIAARLQQAPDVVRERARANLATMRAANADGSADVWLDEWERLLDGPLDELVEVMVGADEHMVDLRQNTPFSGVLTPQERWSIYRRFAP